MVFTLYYFIGAQSMEDQKVEENSMKVLVLIAVFKWMEWHQHMTLLKRELVPKMINMHAVIINS